jgi:putative DNA primase/helicase
MKILGHVLGPDVMVPVPAEMLLDQGFTKSSSGPSPDVMSLRGRRLAARGTYDLEMSYWDQTHTLILLTNDLPHARADDQAFWYRIHVVRFLYSFVSEPNPNNAFEKRKDNDLERNLRVEASGILAWLVRGCLKYLELGGLAPPEAVTEATRAYRSAEDLVGRFLAECCEIKDGLETQAAVLYDNFRWWYGREVSRKWEFSGVRFAEALKKKGFSKQKKSAHYWLNIALTEDFQAERREAEASAGDKPQKRLTD